MKTPFHKAFPLRHVLVTLGFLLSVEQTFSTLDLYQRNIDMIDTVRRSEAGQHLATLRNAVDAAPAIPIQEQLQHQLERRRELGLRFYLTAARGEEAISVGDRKTRVGIINDATKRETLFTAEDRSVWIMPHMGGPPPNAHAPPPPPGMRRRRPPPSHLVEFIPVQANAFKARTQRRLAFGLMGALALLLGTLAMWRLLLQREQTMVELERKRTLAALGKMSAVISHELISPLSGALGHAELLTMTLEEGRPKDKAHVIVEDLERLNLTMRGLLDFLNSGRIERAMHSPDRLLDDATSLFRGPRLTLERVGLPERWSFDLLALGRVLSNVVKNALQISQGPVHVRASMTRDGLCLEVRDHGPGFPQDFDPFSPFATQREGGTGLGLAICLEIVEAHHGSIAAQNHPDGGALVTILIPES